MTVFRFRSPSESLSACCLLLVLSHAAVGGQVVYPAKGQSPEQQKQDESECYTWAVGQTGYDPANPPPMPTATAPSAQPSGPTGARARGALGGALIGEIADGDTGDAALAGAVIGGSRERRDRRQAEQQVQSQAQAQQAAAMEDRQAAEAQFSKARAACLEGRGYSVK
jgi:hypothetical protein